MAVDPPDPWIIVLGQCGQFVADDHLHRIVAQKLTSHLAVFAKRSQTINGVIFFHVKVGHTYAHMAVVGYVAGIDVLQAEMSHIELQGKMYPLKSNVCAVHFHCAAGRKAIATPRERLAVRTKK
ncbi:hypothetical protein D9M71_488620 [compost metagenome]